MWAGDTQFEGRIKNSCSYLQDGQKYATYHLGGMIWALFQNFDQPNEQHCEALGGNSNSIHREFSSQLLIYLVTISLSYNTHPIHYYLSATYFSHWLLLFILFPTSSQNGSKRRLNAKDAWEAAAEAAKKSLSKLDFANVQYYFRVVYGPHWKGTIDVGR